VVVLVVAAVTNRPALLLAAQATHLVQVHHKVTMVEVVKMLPLIIMLVGAAGLEKLVTQMVKVLVVMEPHQQLQVQVLHTLAVARLAVEEEPFQTLVLAAEEVVAQIQTPEVMERQI
jgi:hypothetical protein